MSVAELSTTRWATVRGGRLGAQDGKGKSWCLLRDNCASYRGIDRYLWIGIL